MLCCRLLKITCYLLSLVNVSFGCNPLLSLVTLYLAKGSRRFIKDRSSETMTQNVAKSSLVVEVKEKQESDPILLELKGAVNNQKVEDFSQGGYGVLRYQGRLCVPDVGVVRQHILAEAHNSRYFIHPGDTKIYHDLRGVYCWNVMKRDIEDFVSKCPIASKSRRTSETRRYYSRDRYSYLEVGYDQYGFHHRVTSYS